MTTKRLPIVGFPHLSLAADDGVLHRMLAELQKMGFTIEASAVTPPEGATGPQVIADITTSFHIAKAR